jgi:hypothetical protein
MSLLRWFTRKSPAAAPAAPPESGLHMGDSTRPLGSRRDPPQHTAVNRKGERMARREVLYTVVRECMVRAGVLTSSYKFKVLSLDARARQFLVMVDLAGARASTAQLAEIEAMIAQSAKARGDIVVKAVYWRQNEHVALGLHARTPSHPEAPGPVPAAPAARPVAAVRPAAAAPAAAPIAVKPRSASPVAPVARPGFDPIDADEVAAFKSALQNAIRDSVPAPLAPQPVAAAPAVPVAAKAAKPVPPVKGPRSYTLLTGFEDTEMKDERILPVLSTSQYGDLR